jgi:hypothetical protein
MGVRRPLRKTSTLCSHVHQTTSAQSTHYLAAKLFILGICFRRRWPYEGMVDSLYSCCHVERLPRVP